MSQSSIVILSSDDDELETALCNCKSPLNCEVSDEIKIPSAGENSIDAPLDSGTDSNGSFVNDLPVIVCVESILALPSSQKIEDSESQVVANNDESIELENCEDVAGPSSNQPEIIELEETPLKKCFVDLGIRTNHEIKAKIGGESSESDVANEEEDTDYQKNMELYKEFVEKCCQLEEVETDRDKLKKKMMQQAERCDQAYISTKQFADLVQHHKENLQKDKLYESMIHVLEIVKKNKVPKRVALQSVPRDDENPASTSSATDDGSGPMRRPKEVSNGNDEVIRKLRKTLEKLSRKIQKLGESEVDLDDENDSSFCRMRRYEQRFNNVYRKLCELTGDSRYAGRYMKRRITFMGTGYASVNESVQKWLNKTGTFPDFRDVLKLLEQDESVKNQLSHDGLRTVATNAFLKIGKELQKRRQLDLFDSLRSYATVDSDPADTDPQLAAQLNQNRRLAEQKVQQLIDSWVEKETAENHQPEAVPDDAPVSEGETEREEGDGDEDDVTSISGEDTLEEEEPKAVNARNTQKPGSGSSSEDSTECPLVIIQDEPEVEVKSQTTVATSSLAKKRRISSAHLKENECEILELDPKSPSNRCKRRRSSDDDIVEVGKFNKRPIVIELNRVAMDNISKSSVLQDFTNSPRDRTLSNVVKPKKRIRPIPLDVTDVYPSKLRPTPVSDINRSKLRPNPLDITPNPIDVIGANPLSTVVKAKKRIKPTAVDVSDVNRSKQRPTPLDVSDVNPFKSRSFNITNERARVKSYGTIVNGESSSDSGKGSSGGGGNLSHSEDAPVEDPGETKTPGGGGSAGGGDDPEENEKKEKDCIIDQEEEEEGTEDVEDEQSLPPPGEGQATEEDREGDSYEHVPGELDMVEDGGDDFETDDMVADDLGSFYHGGDDLDIDEHGGHDLDNDEHVADDLDNAEQAPDDLEGIEDPICDQEQGSNDIDNAEQAVDDLESNEEGTDPMCDQGADDLDNDDHVANDLEEEGIDPTHDHEQDSNDLDNDEHVADDLDNDEHVADDIDNDEHVADDLEGKEDDLDRACDYDDADAGEDVSMQEVDEPPCSESGKEYDDLDEGDDRTSNVDGSHHSETGEDVGISAISEESENQQRRSVDEASEENEGYQRSESADKELEQQEKEESNDNEDKMEEGRSESAEEEEGEEKTDPIACEDQSEKERSPEEEEEQQEDETKTDPIGTEDKSEEQKSPEEQEQESPDEEDKQEDEAKTDPIGTEDKSEEQKSPDKAEEGENPEKEEDTKEKVKEESENSEPTASGSHTVKEKDVKTKKRGRPPKTSDKDDRNEDKGQKRKKKQENKSDGEDNQEWAFLGSGNSSEEEKKRKRKGKYSEDSDYREDQTESDSSSNSKKPVRTKKITPIKKKEAEPSKPDSDNDDTSTISDKDNRSPINELEFKSEIDVSADQGSETVMAENVIDVVVPVEKEPEPKPVKEPVRKPVKRPKARPVLDSNRKTPVAITNNVARRLSAPSSTSSYAPLPKKPKIVPSQSEIEVLSHTAPPAKKPFDVTADERVKRFLQNAGGSVSITVKRKKAISEETKQALEQLKKLKNISTTRVPRSEPDIICIDDGPSSSRSSYTTPNRPSMSNTPRSNVTHPARSNLLPARTSISAPSRSIPPPRTNLNSPRGSTTPYRPNIILPPRMNSLTPVRRQQNINTRMVTPVRGGMNRMGTPRPRQPGFPRFGQPSPRPNGLPFISSVQSCNNTRTPVILAVRGSPNRGRGPRPNSRGISGRGRGTAPRKDPSQPVPYVVLD